MWEKYQSLARSVREQVSPILSLPLVAGVATDFWSHTPGNGRAIIPRRQMITSIPEIGPTIANHIGNFGYSAAMMIPLSTLGFAVKEYGRSQDNQVIEMIGEIIPVSGLLGIVAINLAVEGITPHNSQFLGDLIFGLGGALIAHATTRGVLERVQTSRVTQHKLLSQKQSRVNICITKSRLLVLSRLAKQQLVNYSPRS